MHRKSNAEIYKGAVNVGIVKVDVKITNSDSAAAGIASVLA